MSVLVSDTRVVITTADDNTGGTWTGGGGGFDITPTVEGGLAWVGTINIGTDQSYFTTGGAALNADAQMIYVWSNNFAVQNVWDFPANPPNALFISDGTNGISFMMAGSDKKVFSHLLDQDWNWDCLLLDMDKAAELNSNGLTIERAGSFAAFDSSSLDAWGVDFTTLSKGIGGGVNVAVDIIRIGNDGLVITSGSSGDPGLFEQIVVEDRSIESLKAHGIIRIYTTGIYGIQGALTFGTSSAAGSWFEDSDATLVFENRDVADDKYYFKVQGGSAAETTFILSDSSITTAGPNVRCDFSSSGDIRRLEITSVAFNNLGNPVYFGNDISSSFHTISANIFTGCGFIDAGNVGFSSNTISDSTNASGSLLMPSGGAEFITDLEFNAGGVNGHAIYITEAATHSFNNFTYNGFGADGEISASVYNNSAGAVLINVIGGDSPTVRNGSGATTTINNPKILKLTGMVSGTEVTITSGSDETVLFHLESVDTAGSSSYQYNFVADTIVDILVFEITKDPQVSSIFNYTLLSEDATIPIQQIDDNIYFNPGGEGG